MLEINKSAPKSTIISERTNDDCSCTLTPFSATDINPFQSWQVGIFDPSNPLQLDKLGGGIGIGAPVGDVTSAVFVPGDDRFIFITLIPDLDTNPIITIVVTCTGVNADGSTRYFPPQYFTFEWENGVPQDSNGLFRNSRAFAIDIPKDCDVREDVPDCHPNCP